MLQINGAHKSGSGAIVRDAISLAALTGQATQFTNIRANRKKPGLRPQHLRGVEACRQICQGRLEFAAVGSQEIKFWPGQRLRGGHYDFDIGTAGSTALLTAILLPISLFCEEAVTYKLTGGLFQDFAPSAFYLQHILFPVLQRMGVDAELEIEQPGYAPKGQGVMQVKVAPVQGRLKPITMLEQGEVSTIAGFALSSLLAERNVSDRMADTCEKRLRAKGYQPYIQVLYDERESPVFKRVSVQPGACLAVWAETETKCRIASDMAGAIGRSAEYIGKHVARTLMDDLKTGATVDRHLADQLIPFCALADGVSEYVVPRVTEHVAARLWLVEEILGAGTEIRDSHVSIEGIGFAR